MFTLDRCPVCDSPDHEPAAEYNGLIAIDEMRGSELCRYQYRLCHRCGTAFASRRPAGAEYESLYGRFNEMLGREGPDLALERGGPVPPDIETDIEMKPYWWRLAEFDGSLARAMRKEVRVQTAHLGPLTSSIKVAGTRVLEIRSKMGFLASYLTRVLGAREACVMTTWPIQQAVVERLYGLPCVSGANEEKLTIPFAGPFDLVIAPHVFVHAVEPHQFFDEVRRVLAPGGYLYLCQEPDDVRLCNRGKNLFSELKCFHFQQVDSAAYRRALQYNGFGTAHVGYWAPGNERKSLMWALGRLKAARPPDQLGKAELSARKTMYRRWRDESIIALPDHLRSLFADQWSEIARRSIDGGYAQEVDGELRTNRDIYRTYDRSH